MVDMSAKFFAFWLYPFIQFSFSARYLTFVQYQRDSVKWRTLRALRVLVPSMLACPRALVPSCPRARMPKFLACPRAIDVGAPSCLPCWRALVPACPRAQIFGVPSCLPCWRALVSLCLNFRRALVPSMLMFRTLLRDVTLEMFLESLKLSDPFFSKFHPKKPE